MELLLKHLNEDFLKKHEQWENEKKSKFLHKFMAV